MTVRRPSGISLVVSTAPSREVAEEIARRLVEERVAACVNIVPNVTSVFWWDGDVQTDGEVMLVMKVTEVGVDRALRRLSEVHPYDVPEGVVVSVPAGLEPYCRWAEAEISEVTA